MEQRYARFWVELFATVLPYVLVLYGSLWYLWSHPGLGAAWRIALALAPMVPATFAVVVFVRAFGRLDELERRIHLDGLAYGFGGTAFTTFTYGFLQNAGLPDLSWHFVWPIMVLFWGIGVTLSASKYRYRNEEQPQGTAR